ncbi:MAG: hypothetical protein ACRDHO_12440 [Actinomycetota bacterium]
MKRIVVVVALVALVAQSCGGDSPLSKAEYERRVNQIGQQLSDTLEGTFSSPQFQNPTSLKDAADVLRQGQNEMAGAADRLDEVNPPEEIESIHDRFVKGIRDFARDFGTFAEATEKGDLAALQRFSRQISDESLPSMIAVNEATGALKAKGYDISNG